MDLVVSWDRNELQELQLPSSVTPLTTKREKTIKVELSAVIFLITATSICLHSFSNDTDGRDDGREVGCDVGKREGFGVGRLVRLTPRASGDEVEGVEVGCEVGLLLGCIVGLSYGR